MSETYTRANFAGMANSAQELQTIASKLKAELEEMNTEVIQKLNQWEGSAQTAYHVEKGKWDAAADHMQIAIGKFGGAVSTANANYTSAERYGDQLWGA